MKVLGLDKIESFLADCTDQPSREALNAFVYELKHRSWTDTQDLLKNYPQAELSELPKARFQLANSTLFVDGIIHFESGVILLKRCLSKRRLSSGDHTEWEAA